MIVHLFNSSLVSGPETLVIPALPSLAHEMNVEFQVWNLAEVRKNEAAKTPLVYAASFGLKTLEISIRGRFDKNAIHRIADSIVLHSPTIIHAHDVKASIYLLLAKLKLKLLGHSIARHKWVTTHHGIHARNGKLVRIYEWIYRFVFLPFFDRALVVCASDRTILLKQGLDPKKVLVHLNGIDRDFIGEEKRASLRTLIHKRWAERFQVNFKDKVIFGIAARLSPEKNHMLLLNALRILNKKNENWLCLCFGVGGLEAELQKITEEFNLSAQVLWCGYETNLSAAMPGFDLLVSISIGEGLPINLLEAGWAGTPVLAARVDGVADLLPEDDQTLLFSGVAPNPTAEQVAERLEQLIDDDLLRKKLGLQFQMQVKNNFSGTNWKNRLKEIYQSL